VGTLGGVTSVLRGGKFGHGFVSAGVGGLTGSQLQGLGDFGRIVGSAIVGGTVSEVTGGKFANGAAYGAFAAAVAIVGERAAPQTAADESARHNSIEKIKSLPDSVADRQAIYDEGLEAAQAQGLTVDGTKITPKLGIIHLRNRAGLSENFTTKAGALQHLADNPGWYAVDGIYRSGGNISIYATAVSADTITLPSTNYISNRLYKFSIYGRGFSRNITPVENVIQTIAHETGHYLGQTHYWKTGNFGQIHREFDAIATYRGL